MNKYQKELQILKPWDDVEGQCIEVRNGYDRIYTAGHSYLCIPKADKNYFIAHKICKYGFKGELACYLEEDCEIQEFEKAVKKL